MAEKAGLQGRPCNAGRPARSGRPGPTPLKRELSARRFLGMERGVPGGPNSGLPVTTTPSRTGFAATPCCLRTAAGPATLLHRGVVTARA